jgi:hypothetical protein
MTREKSHIDEMIIALEIALHEALDAKTNMIRQQQETPSELSNNTPTEVKG